MGIEGLDEVINDDPLPDGEAERQEQDEQRLRDHEERRERLGEETVEEPLSSEESTPPNPGGGNAEE
jgi:hypothetical protein